MSDWSPPRERSSWSSVPRWWLLEAAANASALSAEMRGGGGSGDGSGSLRAGGAEFGSTAAEACCFETCGVEGGRFYKTLVTPAHALVLARLARNLLARFFSVLARCWAGERTPDKALGLLAVPTL